MITEERALEIMRDANRSRNSLKPKTVDPPQSSSLGCGSPDDVNITKTALLNEPTIAKPK